MGIVNGIANALGRAWFAVFGALPPLLALVIASAIAGVAMAWVFKKTSNQTQLKRVADRTKAHLLRLRLFKDDFRLALRTQGKLMVAIALRLWHSVPPMLVLIAPFCFILVQFALRYEFRPLAPGDHTVVTLQFHDDKWPGGPAPVLQPPIGVVSETPPLRDAHKKQVHWRLRVDAPTSEPLRFRVGRAYVEKALATSDDTGTLRVVEPLRPGASWWDRLLHPAEPAFTSTDDIASIDVRYPRRSTPILGVNMPWWGTFLIVSMLSALIARPWLRVQF